MNLAHELQKVQVDIGLFNCFAFSVNLSVEGCSAVCSIGAGGSGSSIVSTWDRQEESNLCNKNSNCQSRTKDLL